MASQESSTNKTDSDTNESENKRGFPWGIVGPITTAITWIIIALCWVFLYCRNKRQRRERAERRARNLQNQQQHQGGQANSAFETDYSTKY